jgi:hypothetical protein
MPHIEEMTVSGKSQDTINMGKFPGKTNNFLIMKHIYLTKNFQKFRNNQSSEVAKT